MKVAIVSESPADEAAIRIFVEGLLGEEIEAAKNTFLQRRPGGVDAVLNDAPLILRSLHFGTDVEALAVVVDSDRTLMHEESHERPGNDNQKCRLCEIRKSLRESRDTLSPRPVGDLLKIAVGLAVPAVEAWYLVGDDPHSSEASWNNGIKAGKPPYTTKELKKKVYGTDRPQLALETQRATEAARRIVEQDKLQQLEQFFPGGFGALARGVRSWRAEKG